MRIRYYFDPVLESPHIYKHDVTENEVEEVLKRPIEDRAGVAESRVAIGLGKSGRCLRVIYVPDAEPNSVFVITAYELKRKPLRALRRRMRRRRRT